MLRQFVLLLGAWAVVGTSIVAAENSEFCAPSTCYTSYMNISVSCTSLDAVELASPALRRCCQYASFALTSRTHVTFRVSLVRH